MSNELLATIIFGSVNVLISFFLVRYGQYLVKGEVGYHEVPKILFPVAVFTGFIPIFGWMQCVIFFFLAITIAFDQQYLKDTVFTRKWFAKKPE